MKEDTFLYDIYGRLQIEVVCQGETRTAYRLIGNHRKLETDFVIPDGYNKDQICVYLDDMLHEMARTGQNVKLISCK